MTINFGWMLKVTSWENDGDCYNTKTFDGLTEDEVRSAVAMCKELQSIGKVELDADNLEKIAAKLSLHTDEVEDQIYDLVGTAYESTYLRVCESWEVYYIPFDIPDRTSEF